ncbi:MAG: CPBP family intramembrane metalloprotease [Muribaculaceae bacterium]|nr:CPBP family intramembrane metalloprotease [Muribaculaceae bacterium]
MENISLKLTWSPATRVLVLLCMALAGVIIASSLTLCLAGMPRTAHLLCSVVAQDVIAFILPALCACWLIFKRPWHIMGLDRAPSWQAVAIVLMVSIVAMPALNWVIDWNAHIHLPASMAAIEKAMRTMEDAAEAATKQILDFNTIPAMLAVLFAVAVMAGVSEEMFFRGAMLRMMPKAGDSHLWVWVVAVAFSAIHMQFFGFVPRMLLGAWLGYLLVWTRSLWVPMIAHTLNNATVVVAAYLVNNGIVGEGALDHLGVPQDDAFPLLALVSAIATVALVAFAHRQLFFKKNDKTP